MPKLSEYRRFLNRHARLLRITDHYYYIYMHPNGYEVKIKCSLGGGEIPARVWKKILKQLGITQEEFNQG